MANKKWNRNFTVFAPVQNTEKYEVFRQAIVAGGGRAQWNRRL